VNAVYEEVVLGDGKPAVSFVLRTRRGFASGVFAEGRIFVHHVNGGGALKGLMPVLCRRFGTNLVTFSPLVNENIERVVRGVLKWCPASDPMNPFGEDFKYLECEWMPGVTGFLGG